MELIKKLESKNKYNQFEYLFKCDWCGDEVIKQLSNGRRDKSCGCILTPRKTITQENLKIHECWTNMKTRVKNKNYIHSHRYIGRGIDLFHEWERFIPFLKWALENGFKEGLTLDRIDNNKGYYPDNCRFISNKENHRNSSSVKINIKDAEKIRDMKSQGIPAVSIAEIFKISRRQIYNIINNKQWI